MATARGKTGATPRARSRSSVRGAGQTTTDHETIRRWVEARGGCPAHVKRTGRSRGDPGVLRIDFPGYRGAQRLEKISWEEFFAAFEAHKLAFLYQDEKKSGEPSTFSKLVKRRGQSARPRPAREQSAAKTARRTARKPSTAREQPATGKRTARRTTSARTAGARKSASSAKPRSSSAKATTDHQTIRRWVVARGGCPAHVKRTGHEGDPGILRIDYTGFSGQKSLEKISWDKFFEWFEKDNLAFLYQERKKSGEPSTFSKFVSRDLI